MPGSVSQTPGGVGRNIAEAITHMLGESKTILISVLGGDLKADALLAHCRESNMNVAYIARTCSTTPSVVTIFSLQGDVLLSIADVAMIETDLSPELIMGCSEAVQSASFLILDANMSVEALQAACKLAALHRIPIWFEPVSASKAARAVSIMHCIDYISPNEQELIALANALSPQECRFCSVDSSKEVAICQECGIAEVVKRLRSHIGWILRHGVRNIVLTAGASGAAVCTLVPTSQEIMQVLAAPAIPTKIENSSGAGDCLVAGIVSCLVKGQCIEDALRQGIVCGACAVESPLNVPLDFIRNPAKIHVHAFTLPV